MAIPRGLATGKILHIFGSQSVRYFFSLRNSSLCTSSSTRTGQRHGSKYYRNGARASATTNAGTCRPGSPRYSFKDSLTRADVAYRISVTCCCGFSTVGNATLGGIGTFGDDIQQWSKQRLSETTRPEQMKVIMGDLAVRLERQWQLLDQLHQLTTSLHNSSHPHSTYQHNRNHNSSRIQMAQSLETVNKNIHNLKVLHRDTQRTSTYFFETLSASSNLSPLLQRQLGQACKEIYARHALTIETMAEIMIDLRGIARIRTLLINENNSTNDESGLMTQTMARVAALVTTFLKCRLMTQLLCDHVVDCMLHRERKPHGAISVGVNVADLVVSAVVEARHLVEASFVIVADQEEAIDLDVVLEDPPEPPQVNVVMASPSPITATLVRPWLQYALVELLKNSLAITMERNRRDNPHSPYWPIHVHITETSTDVMIHLMDQGGGFQGSYKDWFEFASRRDKWDRLDDQQTYAMVRSPIRGLGVGLSLSRLHLRQFGGELLLEDRPDPQQWTSNCIGSTTTTSSSSSRSDDVVDLHSGLTATLRLSKDWATLETAIEPKSDET